jgi:hypothetical protein
MPRRHAPPTHHQVDQPAFVEHVYQLTQQPVQAVLPGIGDQPGDAELFRVQEMRSEKRSQLLAQSVYHRQAPPRYLLRRSQP